MCGLYYLCLSQHAVFVLVKVLSLHQCTLARVRRSEKYSLFVFFFFNLFLFLHSEKSK